MKTFYRRGTTQLPHAECSSCHGDLVQVPAVGWVDPVMGHSYDMCAADPYGNHSPIR